MVESAEYHEFRWAFSSLSKSRTSRRRRRSVPIRFLQRVAATRLAIARVANLEVPHETRNDVYVMYHCYPEIDGLLHDQANV
jgi:hypothetical protein